MTEEPAIRLVRPLQIEYITVGKVLLIWGNYVYKSTEHEFVTKYLEPQFEAEEKYPDQVELLEECDWTQKDWKS